MRGLSQVWLSVLLAGKLWAFPEDSALPELVEEYLEHPDFITQNCPAAPCYPGACCPPASAPTMHKKNTTPYFQVPAEEVSGTYIFHSGKQKKDAQVGAENSQSETNIAPNASAPYIIPRHTTLSEIAQENKESVPTQEESEAPTDTIDFSPPRNTGLYAQPDCGDKEGFTVNFENIKMVELLQFISQIAGLNFIFDSADLQFTITIVSQEAASVSELTAALMQILKMHNLNVVEQGNTVLIYHDQNLSRLSKVITESNINEACGSAIITRVFKLYTIEPANVANIIKPLLSTDAIVEISPETRHLIVSDITHNVDKVAELLNALDSPNTLFEVAEYQVKGAYPNALVAYAKEILAPLMADNPLQITAQPSSNKIFIVSTPFLIQRALLLLASLDSPDITDVTDLPSGSLETNTMFMYKLKYHPGKDIANALQTIGSNLQQTGVTNMDLVNAAYSTQFIEVNNSLVITGTQDAVEKVIELVNQLDQPPKQVYLEVLVIDTTLTNSLDFGVQWIGLGDEQDKVAYATGLLSNVNGGGPNLQGATTTNPGARYVATQGAPPPTIPNPGRDVALPTPAALQGFTSLSNATEAFGFGIIGNILSHNGQSFLTLGALISALEEEQATKLVLNPRIMAQDTQPADIFVGENIPYQTTSSIIQQTGSVTQNIQYEDIGVHLRITPTIAPNNIVSMEIDQTISERLSLEGTLTPTTTKTLTTTRVHVPDGCFLVMSGHIRDKATTTKSGVPCLGSLPLIGPTFSRTIDQREKRNLIMFLRPQVVTSIPDEIQLTNQEGYDFNWESCPESMIECGIKQAPECERYPPLECPPN